MKRLTFISIILTLIISACNGVDGASFWLNYAPSKISVEKSDQGPWGGTRVVLYENVSDRTITTETVISFATANGWELEKQAFLDDFQISVFRMYLSFALEHMPTRSTKQKVERLKLATFIDDLSQGMMVQFYDTGMVKYNDDEVAADNGLVFIDPAGRRILMYHNWGD